MSAFLFTFYPIIPSGTKTVKIGKSVSTIIITAGIYFRLFALLFSALNVNKKELYGSNDF